MSFLPADPKFQSQDGFEALNVEPCNRRAVTAAVEKNVTVAAIDLETMRITRIYSHSNRFSPLG